MNQMDTYEFSFTVVEATTEYSMVFGSLVLIMGLIITAVVGIAIIKGVNKSKE